MGWLMVFPMNPSQGGLEAFKPLKDFVMLYIYASLPMITLDRYQEDTYPSSSP